MAFSNPIRHLPKLNTELLILLVAILLLVFSLLMAQSLHPHPQERAVPQPVVASPTLPIHFSKLQGSQSIAEPISRTVQLKNHASPLQNAVLQLLNGPTQAEKGNGYYSEIPTGTKLLGIRVQEQTVLINLSKEFVSGGGSTSMSQRVNELLSTVQPIAGKREVHIAIEGTPVNRLGGEGMEIN